MMRSSWKNSLPSKKIAGGWKSPIEGPEKPPPEPSSVANGSRGIRAAALRGVSRIGAARECAAAIGSCFSP
jgi:hypothetical protein